MGTSYLSGLVTLNDTQISETLPLLPAKMVTQLFCLFCNSLNNWDCPIFQFCENKYCREQILKCPQFDVNNRAYKLLESAIHNQPDLSILKTLIKKGANANAISADKSILVFAVGGARISYEGNVTAVRTLIRAGADVNWKDSFDRSAIIFASELYEPKNYVPIVAELIKNGAEIWCMDEDDRLVLGKTVFKCLYQVEA